MRKLHILAATRTFADAEFDGEPVIELVEMTDDAGKTDPDTVTSPNSSIPFS